MTNAPTKATSKSNYIAPRMDYIGAWKALRALMKDREDTAQVFRIMRALTGKSLWNAYQRFAKLEVGKNIIANEIDLLDTLANRKALAKLPEGSVGREYLAFMTREGITAEGLVEASDESYGDFHDKGLERYTMRTREMHDLWHVITGFGRDGLGEFSVVAFSYAQTKSLGFAAIAAMGAIDLSRKHPRKGAVKAVWQAYRNGLKAGWLPGQDWEGLMERPLIEVREMLNIKTPTAYLAAQEVIDATYPGPYQPVEEELAQAA
ncbi:ubiquinone biosynthesis protein COQ4 [Kordiimonas aquimaris]|uniref:ubiquinone biosynthesis protein COQ4 n=1 Tax=Kordiimonas aquimaris TaxID=707591 RepID=UPI0021CEE581|nr:ubiquinone biosynthesis protein COQ4 [Kordiimonas aquimaris]